MAKRELPSPDLLRQLLEYDPETGALTWRWRDRAIFPNGRGYESWNSQYSGKRADDGPSNGMAGYRGVLIFNRRYSAHRVAWAVATGEWPAHQIDHINGDRRDNRLCNLRDVPQLENMRNTALHGRNKTGVSGVQKRPRAGADKWRSYIYLEGKTICLGSFDSFEEAVAVRKEAEKLYGYHPNNGRSVKTRAMELAPR